MAVRAEQETKIDNTLVRDNHIYYSNPFCYTRLVLEFERRFDHLVSFKQNGSRLLSNISSKYFKHLGDYSKYFRRAWRLYLKVYLNKKLET